MIEAAAAAPKPAIGMFERYLSLWVAACIIVGIYLYGLDQAFTRLIAHLVDLQK